MDMDSDQEKHPNGETVAGKNSSEILDVNPKPVESFYPSPKKVARASRWDVGPNPGREAEGGQDEEEEGRPVAKRFKFSSPSDIPEASPVLESPKKFGFSAPQDGMEVEEDARNHPSTDNKQTTNDQSEEGILLSCTSLVAHTVTSHQHDLSGRHCLVAHTVQGVKPLGASTTVAHIVQGVEPSGASATVAHSVQGVEPSRASATAHTVQQWPEQLNTGLQCHSVQAMEQQDTTLYSHTVTTYPDGQTFELMEQEREQVQEPVQEHVQVQVQVPSRSPPVHSVEPSALESSDLVAHIAATFGLEEEKEEVEEMEVEEGRSGREVMGKLDADWDEEDIEKEASEENEEEKEQDTEEEEMEEQLAEQRRADQVQNLCTTLNTFLGI